MAFIPTRREFVKIGAMTGASLLLARERAYAAYPLSPTLQKFIQPLRRFGVDIPIATGTPRAMFGTTADYYEIAMRQFTDTLHPQLPPTTLWGYGNKADAVSSFRHLGGAIIAQSGTPVRVNWTNGLGTGPHILPVDPSLVPPEGAGRFRRVAPHLHGGLVPWLSDGGPFHWFDVDGTVGSSVLPWLPRVSASGQSTGVLTNDYWYPNIQSARMMWYHDHAVGTTRVNAYAGLATGYLLRDGAEAALMAQLGNPTEVPLVVQDKIFNPDGSLWYPTTYDTQFFPLEPEDPLPTPSLVPEFWGDTILMNGTAYPFLEVQPRVYRIRLLNACNTRFLRLRLLYAAGSTGPGQTEASENDPGPAMRVIGTEGGFLDPASAPQGVVFDNTKAGLRLVLAPAERADVLIDFSNARADRPLILYNDAPVPFPGGTPLADFYPGNKKLPVAPVRGSGPDTRNLLQFRVVSGTPESLPSGWTLPDYLPRPTPSGNPADVGLYETVDRYGRLAQNLGTLAGPLTYFDDLPTEIVSAGTTVTWRLFNLTEDTHPIHFHYFNVRIVSRQAINVKNTLGGMPAFSGSPVPPEPQEQGWKETVRANSGECLTLLVDVPPVTTALEPVPIPNSPRLTQYGITGREYVYHCHILEHEEHDMMRPLVVQG